MAERILDVLEQNALQVAITHCQVSSDWPPWQTNYTSDDYVEYTWHAPTSHLYIGRAMLRPPRADYRYPDWPRNALGGFPPAIDPLWYTAGRTIGATLVELMTSPAEVARARAEFVERTGGGIGGTRWEPAGAP